MTIEEIKTCIEGEPEIASRKVNPGETNEKETLHHFASQILSDLVK